MNILIVNPFGIGDVLFTSPMIQLLKEHYPDSKIGFVCNKRTQPMLEANPSIDKVYVYEKDDFRRLWKKSKRKCIKKFINLLKSIKKDEYTVAFDLSLGRWYSFFLMLIGIKSRIGYNYKNRGMFLSVKVTIDGYHHNHIVEYYLRLLRYLDIPPRVRPMNISVPDEYNDKAVNILKGYHIDYEKLILAVAPGGGVSWGGNAFYKHWPAEYFAKLVNELLDRYDLQVLLFGSKGEKDICRNVTRQIVKKNNVYDLSGSTGLMTFIGLMGQCDILICNDGGPLHVAVGQNVKTVSIFGPVNEKVYGPYPLEDRGNIVVSKKIPCRPCYYKFKVPECGHRRCINEIKPNEVLTVVDDIISDLSEKI